MKQLYKEYKWIYFKIQKRMTIYISSKAQKMRALSYIGAEKFTFPPKPDGQTNRHTDGHSIYRVASLLKRSRLML